MAKETGWLTDSWVEYYYEEAGDYEVQLQVEDDEGVRSSSADSINVKVLDKAQNKLDSAQSENNKMLEQAKKESDGLIIEINDKFHASSEVKKKLVENKITQMKETALKEIKDVSIKIAVNSVKKIITTSIDKSKLDNLFEKNLEEAKTELKKINS